MSEVVDSIIADLDVRYAKYVEGFSKATAAVDKHTKAVERLVAVDKSADATLAKPKTGRTSALAAEGAAAESSASRRTRAAKGASDAEKAEAKAAADAVKKAAKEASDAQRVAAKAAADAVKAAEREKQAALRSSQRELEGAAKAAAAKAEADRIAAAAAIAAAERETAARVRLAAVAERAVARAGVTPGNGSFIGATVAREPSEQRGIPAAVLGGVHEGEANDVKEVNHLLADQAALQSRLTTAKGLDRDIIREQLDELRLINRLQKTGLDDQAIALRLDERRVALARQQVVASRLKAGAGGTTADPDSLIQQLVAALKGDGGGGSDGAIAAGLTSIVGVGIGVAVIQSAIDYGNAISDLSDQLGITVEDLQAYQRMASEAGVETTTLSSAFGQFASNLGRAQQGGEEQAKVFRALGVGIDEFKTAGDALPTIIDRISQVKDPLQRAAIETRLFGEEGRKLDSLLSGGAEAVSRLSASLQETGEALSQDEIKSLGDTASKLEAVKNQLSVDISRVVAGNASSIIGLANSFTTLTEAILKFSAARDRGADASLIDFERSRQDLPSLAIGRAAGKSDAQIRREAFQRQLSSPEGRAALRQTIAESRQRVDGKNGLVANLVSPETYYSADQRGKARAYYDRLETQINRADKAPPAPPARATTPVQIGAPNAGLLRTLGAPKPPKGPKGKSADQLEREEEQRTRQYNDQLAQITADYLRAQQQLTGSADKRAEIELQLLDTATAASIADIESQRKRNVLAGADAKVEAARAAILTAKEREARNEQASVIEQERRFAKERALTTATSSLLDARATVLSAELSLARTASERRRLGLALVDNQDAQERERLDGVIRTSAADSPEAAQAKADLARLPEQTALQKKLIANQNMDPLDQYRSDLRAATDDTNAALQSIEVNALQSLEDSLSRSIGKVLGLKGAFGDLITGILTDLARLEIKKGILAFLGQGGEGGGSSGGGIGGIVASIAGAFRGGRASGGNVVGGGSYLVGENGPEILSLPSSGRVYPNGQLPSIGSGRGAMAMTQHITIDARNSVIPEEFAGAILNQANSQARAYAREAGISAVEAGPARVQRVSTLGS